MSDATSPLRVMDRAARHPESYVAQWKQRTGGKAVAIFPMNFPVEIAHAAGALPVIVQEDREPITLGNGLISEFNCAYTRNLVDKVACGRLDVYDGVFMADHCVQLVGAADVVRELEPDRPLYFGQLISSMTDPWTRDRVGITMKSFVTELEALTGTAIDDERLAGSVKAFNEGRRLLRNALVARRDGDASFTAVELQILIKSSMVMDREEHNALLAAALRERQPAGRDGDRIRVHLSGHFCHAPKPELLTLIEEAGGQVVDDDLYHGARYVSTDVAEDVPPVDALAEWYLARNVNIPCPTRAQSNVDWDAYLLKAIAASGAEAVISLMVKYCEPHMLYFPEIKKALDQAHIPHLLLETEHEGMPLEMMRTRIEAMFEQIRRTRVSPAGHSTA
jgi:benzoyl-CoA reductase subunit C